MDAEFDTTAAILVTHRDPVIRLGLSALLSDSRYSDGARSCTAVSESYEDLVRSAKVVIADYDQAMDLCFRMPRKTGYRAAAPAHVMVVSTRDGEQEIRSAIAAGVKGYLISGFEAEEFIAGVDSLSMGVRYLCSAAAHKIVDSMSREELTTREMQVLRCLMAGYVNKRICEELDIALGTVKAHVKAIFSKFGVSTRTQAVSMASQLGLATTDDVARHLPARHHPVHLPEETGHETPPLGHQAAVFRCGESA